MTDISYGTNSDPFGRKDVNRKMDKGIKKIREFMHDHLKGSPTVEQAYIVAAIYMVLEAMEDLTKRIEQLEKRK